MWRTCARGWPSSTRAGSQGGAPAELVRALQGRVWRRAGDKAALADYQSRLEVISTRLRGGQTVIHVVADAAPETGFEPVEVRIVVDSWNAAPSSP